MAVSGRFLKDSGLALTGRVVPRALYLLQAVLVARWLGPELNGRYAYGFSVMMLAGTLGKFGLDTLTTREVARCPAEAPRIVGHNLMLHAGLGLAGLLLMAASGLWTDKTPDVDALVALLGVAMLCNSLSLSYTAALAGLGRFELQAAADTLLYGLMLGGSVLAMRLGAGIVGIGAAMAAASAAQLGVCWLLGRRVLGPADLRFDPLLARSLLEMAWPLALTGVAIGIYTRIDSVFLSLLHGDRQVGLYDAAYTFIHGLRQVPAALCLAALPMLTRLVPEDRARLASTVGSIVRVGLGVGLPLVVLAWIGAELLLSLIYSAPYLPAARPLRILLGTIPLMLADGAQSYLLIAAGRQRRLLGVTMLGAASNLALNLALIPPLGMEGAAIATLVSEAIVLVATQHGVRDLYGWGEFRRSLLGPFGRSGRG